LLGVGIIAGGAVVKVPQILTVLSAKSARGLSLSSYLLDTAATAITVAYNVRNGFPLSTYGEMVFLLAQNVSSLSLLAN
jgi:mannose-P-dolichol utilization defect protein 1